jgi:hypothetical protein
LKCVNNLFFFILIIISFKSYYSEDYYQFSKAYAPSSIEFEKKRTICFFPFRNDPSEKYLDYLSKGIPGVIASSFRNLKYTFDPNPLPIKFQHVIGTKSASNHIPINHQIETDSRYIKLDLEIINSTKSILKEEALSEGKNSSCFYMITGEYKVTNSDNLTIIIEITESKNGSFEKFRVNTSVKRSFQELGDALIDIKSKYFLSGSSSLTLDLNEKDTFVYLDGELYGKTPIIKSPILPGKHKLLLIKEGFKRIEKSIEVLHGIENKLELKLEKIETLAIINILSNPSEAEIYIGNKFIGKTPIENTNVPKGQNRVRASKEGYIDKFSSIDIKDSKSYSMYLNLKEGDTNIFYKYNNNLFLDYTYTDFGNYSLLSSLLFYGLYTYSGYKESSEKDKLNGREIFNSISIYRGLELFSSNEQKYQNLFLSSALYQQRIINQVEDSTAIYRQAQQIGIGGMVTMLIFSGYFFYTGFNSESFEIGLKPSLNSSQSSEASFQYNFKF